MPFSAIVNAVDVYYNLVVSTNAPVSLYSDDTYGTPSVATPLTKTLAAGSTSFTFTLLSGQTVAAGALTHQPLGRRAR